MATEVVAVMRVTTLKASGDGLTGLLTYYAGLAEDRERRGPSRGPVDYYLDPDEPKGRWWGGGRAALGLAGPVQAGDLRSLLEGTHPVTGGLLGRRFGDASARGFDATFSAPKSVSLLWALTPDAWVRAEVLAAHDAAVDSALGWFERHGALTRRGRDGVFQVDSLGVTAALFRQHTSRSMDPQLHTHAVISAKVQDETGRWLALDARFLKYQQRGIGWIYDAALRTELTGRFGVDWLEPKPGVLDLACIPDGVCDGFSKRSTQVDAKLADLLRRWSAEHDGADPDPRTIAGLQRAASLASRPGKSHGVDAQILRGEWAAEAQRFGFDPQVLVPESIEREMWPVDLITDDEAIDEALWRVSDETATWLRADLARHLATILDPDAAATAEALVVEIDRLAELAESRCLGLHPEPDDTIRCRADGRPVAEQVTDRRLTTPGVLRQEQGLQSWAATNTRQSQVTGDPVGAATDAIAGHEALVIVVGPAGTGKTRATAAAIAALGARGRPVVGLAPSGKAADVLAAEAQCRTQTVAGFLNRHSDRLSHWPAGTTVVLDEAGMTATADLTRLVDLVRANQWRLVAVGDPEQLPSVARGGVFAHWCNTVAHHTLTVPRRFEQTWEAAASLALRAGDLAAVDAYGSHGRLHTVHPALAAFHIARAHQQHVGAGRTVAITTSNADTARTVNLEIQRCLHGAMLGGVGLHDGTDVKVGDQIASRRNDPQLRTDKDQQVRNRQTWTVTATHPDGSISACHQGRGRVVLTPAYVRQHVELGWAVTGYGNQGDTVDIGLTVLEASSSRNHAYVALTRGRQSNHALLIDADGTGDPTDLLTQIINRPTSCESALAVQQRLHRAAGLEPPEQDLVDAIEAAPNRPIPPEPEPKLPAYDEPTLDQKVQAMQQRLDRLEQPGNDRSLGRSLGR